MHYEIRLHFSNRAMTLFLFVIYYSACKSFMRDKICKHRVFMILRGNDVIFRDTNTRSWLKLYLKLKAVRGGESGGWAPVRWSHTRFCKFRLIGQARGDPASRSSRVPPDRSIDHSWGQYGCGRAIPMSFFDQPSRHPGSKLKDRTWNRLGDKLFAISFWLNNIARFCILACTRISVMNLLRSIISEKLQTNSDIFKERNRRKPAFYALSFFWASNFSKFI